MTTAVCLIIGLKTSKILLTWQSLIILLMMLLASSNSLLHLWFSGDLDQTINIFVSIIVSGIVISNRTHWTSSVMFNWIG